MEETVMLEMWDDDDDDDVLDYQDDEEPLELGPCCACGKAGPTVRNVMMLNKRGPTPGKGWGCFQCGLPMDGATAVLCDACLEGKAKIIWVCDGYPKDGVRVRVDALSPERFDHDMSKHPEAQFR
jgi:hypothetical protein